MLTLLQSLSWILVPVFVFVMVLCWFGSVVGIGTWVIGAENDTTFWFDVGTSVGILCW